MKRTLIAFLVASMLLTLPACAYSPDDVQQPEVISSSAPTAYASSVDTPTLSDVPDGAWYAEAVRYCMEKGLMDGTSSTAFSPGESATRAVLVTALYRQAGSPTVQQKASFTDVPDGASYADAVSWAAANSIAGGYGDGRFGGEDPVTREQFAAMLWRTEGQPDTDGVEAFADQNEISAYAVNAVTWARNAGIVSGKGNNLFDPKANITRGEVAAMLYRWLNLPQISISSTTQTVTLNSGWEMPILGLGTWTQDSETTENSVYEAIKAGYRLIDTAQYYGNEAGVGAGVRKAIDEGIVKREEVFITTKVMPTNYQNAAASITASNDRLGLDYIDLMLVHQSGNHDKDAYAALEQAVKDGTVRSIGISNYYTTAEFERMIEGVEILPAVVQNENHIFYQNTEFQSYLEQYGTVLESYYPFGGRGHTSDSMNHAIIQSIAQKYEKTGAQIILRWHLQAGYIAIPGSSNPDHIRENYDVFDFELTEDEMAQIAALDTGRRYENW